VTPQDRLAIRVEELNRELDRLRRENERLSKSHSTLRAKKDIAPKPALSLDKQSARRLTSDVGAPAMIAGATVYIWLKILNDVGARTFMGLTTSGFWSDPEILNWVTAGLTICYATAYKFTKKY